MVSQGTDAGWLHGEIYFVTAASEEQEILNATQVAVTTVPGWLMVDWNCVGL